MKRLCSVFLIFILCFTNVIATDYKEILNITVQETARYLEQTVPMPKVGSIGGEWAVIGLARSGCKVSEDYYDDYYQQVLEYIKESKGTLHNKKYTEYSRVCLALTAIGADPTDIGGYNLLKPLGDFDKTVWQGMNGPIWALVALDSKNYKIPTNKEAITQATREMYVDYILQNQNDDGGWSLLSNSNSDPDITGMALQVLSNYTQQDKVTKACDSALYYLSKVQNEKGGFNGIDGESIEVTAQVIVALSALDIPLEDDRFVKNGNNLLDNLLSFNVKDGGFKHKSYDEKADIMATEQAFYALVALERAKQNNFDLYEMKETNVLINNHVQNKVGLDGKNEDILKTYITSRVEFPDTDNNSVLELASRKIINGKSDGNFYPNNTMTRAEFATVIVKALGLTPKPSEKFTDVIINSYYSGYVGTAVRYGIIHGTSDTTFNPNGIITNEEAAVMIARAAKLCGMNVEYDETSIRNVLSQFIDYINVSGWAKESMAFCYDTGILDSSDLDIMPKENITRIEVVNMIYRLLEKSNLL